MQGPLSAWVEKECAGVLLQHLLQGFPLNVYAPQEFCMIYWSVLIFTLLHIVIIGFLAGRITAD